MTTVGKVVAVLVFFASAAFLGMAAATSVGRTDWKVQLKDYQSKTARQPEEIDRLTKDADRYASRLKEASELIAIDVAALEVRKKELADNLDAVSKSVSELSGQVSLKSNEAHDARTIAAQRREDAIQLRNQYELLLTEREAIQSQVKRLQDLLRQAIENLKAVEYRRKLLEEDGGLGYDAAEAADETE
jgi:chromosome segregation ATPase